MATDIFKGISFELPTRGKLEAASEIGERCGAAWFRDGVGDLPRSDPDEISAWSPRRRYAWRSGLVRGWNAAKEEVEGKEEVARGGGARRVCPRLDPRPEAGAAARRPQGGGV